MRTIFRNLLMPFLLLFLLLALFGCASTPSLSDNSAGEYVWPRPPETPRVKWLSEWYGKKDFGSSGQVMTFLIGDEKDERLRRPNGIVADLEGSIYVADSEQRIIFVFDQKKKSLRFLGFGSLAGPVGLAIDNKRGIIFVSDSRLKKVMGFDKDADKNLITVGSLGEFQSPSGMVYDNERDRLYVSDTRAHHIKVFDKDGKLLFTIGKHGNADGELNFPSYLALDKDGRLYVVDAFNFRIQIFDAEGKFIKKFGKLGDGSGSFSRPCGIGVDSDGNIYVADAAFNNFQIFNGEGKLLLWVGHTGKKPGGFYLPSGLFIDNKDKIYVSDTFNRRLQVFQYLSYKK
jgi:DNA-binding beta-propeller fold protein YncE